MAWPKKVHESIKRLNYVKSKLGDRFADRQPVADLLVLGTVCQENILIVGPPGTAKTDIITRYADMLDMTAFHYLLTRFTEPSELFGPLDLEAFRSGTYSVRTESMLPTADIAFLDEVFQGSSAILNAMLTILNERIFHNGSVRQRVPILSFIGATNTVPDDPSLRAFADRFALRLRVDPVDDDKIDDLLDKGWALEEERITRDAGKENVQEQSYMKREEVQHLHGHLREVKLGGVRHDYTQLIRELRAEGVEFSDRRTLKGLKLIAGGALLRESDEAEIRDFWPIMHLWARPEEADTMREVVQDRMSQAGVSGLDAERPVAEILEDLATIRNQQVAFASYTAAGARLMATNKLRRELIADHPSEVEARTEVEKEIQATMERMEVNNV
jgi:MoxR-like ATPase